MRFDRRTASLAGLCVIWAVAASLAVNLHRPATTTTTPASPSASVSDTVTPYTVVLNEVNRWPGGRRTPTSRFTNALRSDGAFVRIWDDTRIRPPGRQTDLREVYFVDGLFAAIDGIRELKSTVQRAATPLATLRDPNSNCLRSFTGKQLSTREAMEGEEMVGGHRTVRIRSGRRESWHALTLGCAVVRTRVDFGSSVTEETVERITGGEPEPWLFEIPHSYVEVPPSRMYGLDPGSPAALQRDQYYQAHRPKLPGTQR